MNNRPRGRQRNITGQGKDVKRRGVGLGSGPVGKVGRTPQSSAGGAQRGNTTRSGGKLGGSKLILILLALLLGGGGGLGTLLFGGGNGGTSQPSQNVTPNISYEQLFGNLAEAACPPAGMPKAIRRSWTLRWPKAQERSTRRFSAAAKTK